MKFDEGDLVIPKTGGPIMSVETGLRSDHLISTIWIDNNGHTQRDCFAPNALWKLMVVEDKDTP